MLSVGMRLPRKSLDKTRTLHACVGMFCVIGFCEVCLHAWLCITLNMVLCLDCVLRWMALRTNKLRC